MATVVVVSVVLAGGYWLARPGGLIAGSAAGMTTLYQAVQLSNGKVLVLGGTKAYPAADNSHGYEGLQTSYVFNPVTDRYQKINNLIGGHWLPSATELGNGDAFPGSPRNSNSVGAGSVFAHTGGRIVFCNPASVRLLGAVDAHEILGRTPFDLEARPAYSRGSRTNIGITRSVFAWYLS